MVEKTVILSSGLIGGCWVVSRDEPTLEASLIAKYLEVDLSKVIEARMISTAQDYAHIIGLDRSKAAHPNNPICR